jgi:CHAD domain-containing protein
VVRVRLREGDASLPGTRETASVPTLLHLEPLKGYEGEFKRAASVLRKSFRLRPQDRSELAMVLGVLGRAPGDYSSFRLDLDPELRSGEALKAVNQRLLDTMLANQEGLIQDLDPEFLHDYRVAVRRTRSALAQVPGVFPEPVLLRFSEEFRWLGERTGPTRDIDVYLLKIPAYQRALPEGVRDELEPLVRFLSKKKRVQHRRMVRSLESKRYARLVDDWSTFLKAPAEMSPDLPNAARPIRLVAAERIWKVYRKVLKRGRKTDRKTSPETLHRLRIDCKRLRYLMTLFQSLFPGDALKPLIRELKNLQDNLGDFNDLYVQRAALLGFAGEMLASGAAPPATLMAMGQLMGQLEARQSVEGEAFRARFQRFGRTRNQTRFRSLFGPVEEDGRTRKAVGRGPVPAAADETHPGDPHEPGTAPPAREPASPEGAPGPTAADETGAPRRTPGSTVADQPRHPEDAPDPSSRDEGP